MKQDQLQSGTNVSRIAYLVSVFTTDMITETENIELNNWLENNPENCALFDSMTIFLINELPLGNYSNPVNC